MYLKEQQQRLLSVGSCWASAVSRTFNNKDSVISERIHIKCFQGIMFTDAAKNYGLFTLRRHVNAIKKRF